MREEGEEREKGASVTKSTMATNFVRLTYFKKKTACSQKLKHHNADQETFTIKIFLSGRQSNKKLNEF